MTRSTVPVAPSWVRFGLVGAWGLFVLYASVSDPSGAPLARTGPFGVVGLDKWLHALAYGVLAVLLAYALVPRWRGTWRGLLATLVLAAAYGIAIETLQYGLPHRSFDPSDLAANVFGALVVVVVVALGTRTLDRLGRGPREEPRRR